ncbi:MAGUK p55 subfamily member 7-like isoform X1 [Tigriopus californicus]|uniref:MAGUK p55 subfamily member 7-like isoform X1 n=1 Tax=Tigriopus californicus TaxID=6832 RepID=UPI0027D9E4BD|nr:MAGUK p55 subfamily member 7-like isoform X1 [Tigriopus californicus]
MSATDTLPKSLKWTCDPAISQLISCMDSLGPHYRTEHLDSDPVEDFEEILHLLSRRELNSVVKIHNIILFCNQEQCPCVSNSCQIAIEVMEDVRPLALMIEECRELYAILTTPHIRSLMASHDIVAQRDYIPKLNQYPEEVDEDEESMKIVQLVKSHETVSDGTKDTEPIVGATIKADEETGKILIARVMHGGAADRSGLISVGDEVVEVNGINVQNKSPADVLQILQMAQNTITFKLIPNEGKPVIRESRVRLRALFTYDPSDDTFIPCKEAGLSFVKGEVLHIVSQDDQFWWQARKENDRNMRAGLIPSRVLQEKRVLRMRDEMMSNQNSEATLSTSPLLFTCGSETDIVKCYACSADMALDELNEQAKLCSQCTTELPNTLTDQLCSYGRRIGERSPPLVKKCCPARRTKKVMYTLTESEDFDREEIPTYEDVARLFPRPGFFRPIILIGPNGVGRHELKKRLLAIDLTRFSSVIPHTSRPPKMGEIHGMDYYFDTRSKMLADIASGLYLEHGEFKGNIYGTRITTIIEHIEKGLQPVLIPHYQGLKVLRTQEIKPFTIYVKPPERTRLILSRKETIGTSKSFTESDFDEMILQDKRLEFHYGHLFDVTVVNDDIDVAVESISREISRLDQDAQWVPSTWVQ